MGPGLEHHKWWLGGHQVLLEGQAQGVSRPWMPSSCRSAPRQMVTLWAFQHLHFMTNLRYCDSTAEQRVTATTNLALSWLKFAYRVATGDPGFEPASPLSEAIEREAGLPSVALNHCVKDRRNVKIRTIFTLHDPSWTDDYRLAITPDVALGTMLHVIQDSFSPAHTCRVRKQTKDGMYAVLVDVENYNEQDKDSHGDLDNYPLWLVQQVRSGKHMFENDPINLGAWLIRAVGERLPWGQVEAHLRSTIFASDNSKKDTVECIGGRALALKQ